MIEIDYDLRWLRCREAASLLNVSEATIRRWLYREKLEGLKVGGVARVDRLSIEKMVARHRYANVRKTQRISALSQIFRWKRDHDLMG